MNKIRCGWVNLNNEVYVDYHDNEWGKPLRNDILLFQLLCLEGAQAGLSWETILNKRRDYMDCFWDLNPGILVNKTEEDLLSRIKNYKVVQNKLKTTSLIKNAKAYYTITKDHGSFAKFLWSYVCDTPIVNTWDNYKDTPSQTELSAQLSKDLKKYGFGFVGPTICYAFMQACGMVSDHEKKCFCVSKIK
jgi:DNA-3-methyladenine glycosylase I